MIIIINSNSTKNDRKTTDARQRRGVGPSRYRLDLFRLTSCFCEMCDSADSMNRNVLNPECVGWSISGTSRLS